ncbi:lysozyme inhibitor LprI family protein [Methylobacter sp.]|uniref:lysozyme inhibitor LprI family protein n=1 Tax=Methylobacter sp. TaxID=2051955 RepID=UPI002FDCACB0
MNIKIVALLLFTGLMLAGCNNLTPVSSCSSADAQKIIGQLITERAAKLTADKKYDYYDGSFVFGGVKVKALLAQLQIAVENINTVKEDSNNKKLCSGVLKVAIPANILADANQARKIQHEPEIALYAEQFNIENSGNVFTQDIEYRVQLIGKSKAQQVEIEDAGWANVLDQIITFALLKPTLEVKDNVQLDEQPKQNVARVKSQLEQEKPEAEQAKLEDDKLRATLQKQGLEKLNKELLEAEQVKKEMLQEQASQQAATQSSAPTTKQISPSFNCSKASKPTEVTICAHSDLAALDVKNRDLYDKAKSINATATKEIWKESIKSKYACGTDVGCIKESYNQSIKHYECVGAGKTPDCAVDSVDQ